MKNPEANVAVTHDDDLCGLIGDVSLPVVNILVLI